MLSSTILDVVAGLVFVFLAVSLATGAIVEAINSIFKLRSTTLIKGVKDLVNDPTFNGLAKDLYQHALINPRGPGTVADARKLAPAYIDPKQFANALVDIIGLSDASAQTTEPGQSTVDKLVAALGQGPLQGNQQMLQLITGAVKRANGDLDAIRKELCGWFDSAMDRVSGAFKRWTQLASFLVALLLCVGMNVDSIAVTRALWEQPKLAEEMKMLPDLEKLPNQPSTTVALRSAEDGLQQLTVLGKNLPIGWPDSFILRVKNADTPVWFWKADNWPTMAAGWVITALATLFGAPFWFDLLQTFTRLKGTGPSPQEKKDGTAASA